MDVGLVVEGDPEPEQGLAQRRDHPLGPEAGIALAHPEEDGGVVTLGLRERHPDPLLEPGHQVLEVEVAGALEEAGHGVAEAVEVDPFEVAVEGGIALEAELPDPRVVAAEDLRAQRVEPGGLRQSRPLQRAAALAVGLVLHRDRDAVVGHDLAVDRHRGLGLGGRELVGEHRQVALHAELRHRPGEAGRPAALGRIGGGVPGGERGAHRVGDEDVGVPEHDREDLQRLLLAARMEVVLHARLAVEGFEGAAQAVDRGGHRDRS